MNATATQERPIDDEELKFRAYVEVQNSGVTNMFDTQAVMALAYEYCEVVLLKDDITYIMRNYRELTEKYGRES